MPASFCGSMELLDKGTVRPVFKCRVSQRHQTSLERQEIWVDAEQLAADSGNFALAMAYAAKESQMIDPAEQNQLESLLNAIMTINGAEGEKGDEENEG